MWAKTPPRPRVRPRFQSKKSRFSVSRWDGIQGTCASSMPGTLGAGECPQNFWCYLWKGPIWSRGGGLEAFTPKRYLRLESGPERRLGEQEEPTLFAAGAPRLRPPQACLSAPNYFLPISYSFSSPAQYKGADTLHCSIVLLCWSVRAGGRLRLRGRPAPPSPQASSAWG